MSLTTQNVLATALHYNYPVCVCLVHQSVLDGVKGIVDIGSKDTQLMATAGEVIPVLKHVLQLCTLQNSFDTTFWDNTFSCLLTMPLSVAFSTENSDSLGPCHAGVWF